MERYTEYHCGVAVIKNKELLKEAMAKLASYEDAKEEGRLKVLPEDKFELIERYIDFLCEDR